MTEALVRTRFQATLPKVRRVAGLVEAPTPAVPRFRGVAHEKAFAFAPALGLLLVVSATGMLATIAASVFAATMALMLGVSAANHRVDLDPRWLPWMRRLDHMTVNLFYAGTCVSFALVVPSSHRVVVTLWVCAGAAAASLLTIAWVQVPGWIPTTIGLVAGLPVVLVLPEFGAAVGTTGLCLFVLGGISYTVGVIVYAVRWPSPFPASFGYHEIFHALVVVGVACHYATFAFFVLPFAS